MFGKRKNQSEKIKYRGKNMNMDFERKLAIPMEVKEMYPLTGKMDKVVEEKTINTTEIIKYQMDGWRVVSKQDKNGNIYIVAQKIQKVPRKTHWEYEKGWRDGDFTYKFDGETFKD